VTQLLALLFISFVSYFVISQVLQTAVECTVLIVAH